MLPRLRSTVRQSCAEAGAFLYGNACSFLVVAESGRISNLEVKNR